MNKNNLIVIISLIVVLCILLTLTCIINKETEQEIITPSTDTNESNLTVSVDSTEQTNSNTENNTTQEIDTEIEKSKQKLLDSLGIESITMIEPQEIDPNVVYPDDPGTVDEFIQSEAVKNYISTIHYGIPVELYGVSKMTFTVGDVEYYQYDVGVKNTHLKFAAIKPIGTDEEWSFSECSIPDGSDYSVIYFTNGVPEYDLKLYTRLYDLVDWDVYYSDYTGGDTITLTSVTTGETFTVQL